MADYDLTRLGSGEFEHLAQALVTRLIPGVQIFGAGKDGGREATTHQPFTLPDGSEWSGYTVAQAKFRARPREPADNLSWLKNAIGQELAAWVDPKQGRTPRPTNLLFITNVVLSAVPGKGQDLIGEVFADYAEKLPLVRWAVWHYDYVCRLLDDAPSIRTAFAGLITPGDVLSELHRTIVGEAADLGGCCGVMPRRNWSPSSGSGLGKRVPPATRSFRWHVSPSTSPRSRPIAAVADGHHRCR